MKILKQTTVGCPVSEDKVADNSMLKQARNQLNNCKWPATNNSRREGEKTTAKKQEIHARYLQQLWMKIQQKLELLSLLQALLSSLVLYGSYYMTGYYSRDDSGSLEKV